jgi:hypothetical protein
LDEEQEDRKGAKVWDDEQMDGMGTFRAGRGALEEEALE